MERSRPTLPSGRDQSSADRTARRPNAQNVSPGGSAFPGPVYATAAPPTLVTNSAVAPQPTIELHKSDGVGQYPGSRTLKRILSQSEASQSDLGFSSLEPIKDRGMEAHLAWQKSTTPASSAAASPTTSPTSNESSPRARGSGATLRRTRNQGSTSRRTQSIRDSINIESICDQICDAFLISAFNQKSYLPLDQLHQIITPTVVRSLLRQQFREDKIRDLEHAIFGDQGSDTKPRRRRIFTVLILVGRIERIQDFIDKDIDDTALPFIFESTRSSRVVQKVLHTNTDPPKEFTRWPSKLAHDFSHYQQVVHVPFLKFPDERIYFYHLQHQATLPFKQYTLRDSGGYGSVRQAEIHHAHHNKEQSIDGKKPQLVAVKQLHVPNREDYLEEVGVFDKLGLASKDSMTSHLVPLQLTYKHGRDYFLIFPWADGNLKQFWKKQRSNPRSQSMVCWFFHQCWGISRGLRKIHHLGTQIKNSSGANMLDAKDLSKMVLNTVAVDRLWGRHGDIKPENILWFKDYEGKPNHLVISDFGLTRFNSAQSKSRVHHEQIQGFSGTYRPPDMHLDETISQKYDVWSLGCVFLEFISWLLLGSKAVDDFARARTKDEAEKQTEATEDKFFGIVGPVQGKQYPILKESVVKWIDKLHKSARCTEPLHSFLDLIQYTMLLPISTERWRCKEISDKLRELCTSCNKDHTYAVTSVQDVSNRLRHVLSDDAADTARSSARPQRLEVNAGTVRGFGGQFDDVIPSIGPTPMRPHSIKAKACGSLGR